MQAIDIDSLPSAIKRRYLQELLKEHVGIEVSDSDLGGDNGVKAALALLVPMFHGQGAWKEKEYWYAQLIKDGRVEVDRDAATAIIRCMVLSHLYKEFPDRPLLTGRPDKLVLKRG